MRAGCSFGCSYREPELPDDVDAGVDEVVSFLLELESLDEPPESELWEFEPFESDEPLESEPLESGELFSNAFFEPCFLALERLSVL